jgi:glucose-6-phosphate isomerase
MLHQSPTPQPLEFMIAAKPVAEGFEHMQKILIANCFAQSQALAYGRSEKEAEDLMIEGGMGPVEARELAPHRTFPGNRPSTLLMYRELSPRTLGRIIALAEARCFTEGVFWGVNSFDQWGVELGKVLATDMLPHVEGRFSPDMVDEALSGPLAHYHGL